METVAQLPSGWSNWQNRNRTNRVRNYDAHLVESWTVSDMSDDMMDDDIDVLHLYRAKDAAGFAPPPPSMEDIFESFSCIPTTDDIISRTGHCDERVSNDDSYHSDEYAIHMNDNDADSHGNCGVAPALSSPKDVMSYNNDYAAVIRNIKEDRCALNVPSLGTDYTAKRVGGVSQVASEDSTFVSDSTCSTEHGMPSNSQCKLALPRSNPAGTATISAHDQDASRNDPYSTNLPSVVSENVASVFDDEFKRINPYLSKLSNAASPDAGSATEAALKTQTKTAMDGHAIKNEIRNDVLVQESPSDQCSKSAGSTVDDSNLMAASSSDALNSTPPDVVHSTFHATQHRVSVGNALGSSGSELQQSEHLNDDNADDSWMLEPIGNNERSSIHNDIADDTPVAIIPPPEHPSDHVSSSTSNLEPSLFASRAPVAMGGVVNSDCNTESSVKCTPSSRELAGATRDSTPFFSAPPVIQVPNSVLTGFHHDAGPRKSDATNDSTIGHSHAESRQSSFQRQSNSSVSVLGSSEYSASDRYTSSGGVRRNSSMESSGSFGDEEGSGYARIRRTRTTTTSMSPKTNTRGRGGVFNSVFEKIFGDLEPLELLSSRKRRSPSQITLSSCILPRTPLPSNIEHNDITNVWITTLDTDQKALDKFSDAKSEGKLTAYAFDSEAEAVEAALAYAPPRMMRFANSPKCLICEKKFAMLHRASHCRNCGVCVCSRCTTLWPSSMLPETYNIKHESMLKVCKACDWLSDTFRIALLDGKSDEAFALYTTGNVNLRTPFAKIKGETFYPIHCAAIGGNVNLLKWLVDTHHCPINVKKISSQKKSGNYDVPIVTSKGRTLLDIAMQNQKISILRYLVAEKDVSMHKVKDLNLTLVILESVLRKLPASLCNDDTPGLSSEEAVYTSTQATANAFQGANNEDTFQNNILPAVSVTSQDEIHIIDSQQYNEEESGKPSAPPSLADGDDVQSLGDEACIICFENRIDCVITPCGHQICCLECSSNISTCPVCNSVCSFIRTFRP